MSGALVPAKRARRGKPPAQVGNVVPLHPAPETTEDIVRDVRERTLRQEQDISRQLQDLVAFADKMHRKRAEECVLIGDAMTRPTLEDWIEIGQRMLAAKGRRI